MTSEEIDILLSESGQAAARAAAHRPWVQERNRLRDKANAKKKAKRKAKKKSRRRK